MIRFASRILRGDTPAFAVLLTVATQMAVVLINVVTGVITARLLGAEGRGVFAAVTLWPQFLASVAQLGLPIAMVYFLRNHPADARRILSAGLVLALAVSAVATGAGLVATEFFMRKFSRADILLADGCILFTVTNVLVMLLRQAMTAQGRFRAFNISSTLPPLLYMLLLLAALALLPLTPGMAALALMLSSPLTLGWIVWTMRGGPAPTPSGLAPWCGRIIHFTSRTAPMEVASNLLLYIDRLVLITVISAEELGLYVVAFSLSRLMLVLQTAVQSVVYPSMSGRAPHEMKALHDQAFRLVCYAVAGAVAGTTLLGTTMLGLVYGADYRPAGALLNILIIEAGVTCIGHVVVQLYLAMGRPGYASVAQVTSLGVACAGLAVLVPQMGAAGAAWSLVAGSAARLVVLLVGVRMQLKMEMPRLWPSFDDLAYLRAKMH